MFKELIPVTARGEATRRKLLVAAEAEFGVKGFHAASVSSITSQAGVGQGTFYLYFRSKEEIFGTLVRDIGELLRRSIERAERQASNPQDAQRRSLEAFLSFAQEYPGRYRIVQEAQFVDADAFRDYYECLARSYGEAFDEVSTGNGSRPEDAQVRAWSLLGIGHFLGLRYCLWQGRLPAPQVLDDVIRMIGYGKTGGTPTAPSASSASSASSAPH